MKIINQNASLRTVHYAQTTLREPMCAGPCEGRGWSARYSVTAIAQERLSRERGAPPSSVPLDLCHYFLYLIIEHCPGLIRSVGVVKSLLLPKKCFVGSIVD